MAFFGKGADCTAAGVGIKGLPGGGATPGGGVTVGGTMFFNDDLFFLLVFVLIVIYLINKIFFRQIVNQAFLKFDLFCL
ncbi:MAG: hypothetical protein EBQ72_00075 [Actinobacteria bacterium]|nr:hypothetical protein [Actinomycetota bacterium]